jgi:hypothetical protein
VCEVSSHRHSAYLTDMRRNASAGFGLRVERVPVAYQRIEISEKVKGDITFMTPVSLEESVLL